jgi:intein-encoded DNA endonuclease-like protein
MKKEERIKLHKRIFDLRNSGYNYSKISKKLNVSYDYARNIYFKMAVKPENTDVISKFQKSLSQRAQNALIDYFGGIDIFINPNRLADSGKNRLLKIKNLGRKTINEIASSLEKHGFLSNKEEL